MALPRMVSTQQVADTLNVKPSDVYRLQQQGKIRGARVSGVGWRFLEDDIHSLLASGGLKETK